MSRPALYREDYPEMAFRLSCPGLTDAQIAFSLGINERTLNRWKKQYPGFCQSLKAGKDFAETGIKVKGTPGRVPLSARAEPPENG